MVLLRSVGLCGRRPEGLQLMRQALGRALVIHGEGGAVLEKILHRRDTTLVRRLTLAPGEATPWHRDPFHRVSVVLSGDALAIEYRDGRQRDDLPISPGQADWDEPTDLVHRAVNVGEHPYEEVTIFFLDHPDAVPQPRADEP